MENKNHSPPLHQEPSVKQRRDLTILPSFVIRLLICYNFLYNQIKILHALNFSEETRDCDSVRDTLSFSTDEKVVAQVDIKMLGFTVESLVIKFDQEKLNSPKASGASRRDNLVSPNVSSETRAMTHN